MSGTDRRKRWLAWMVCFLCLEAGVCKGIYAGAFGGFDIDIGGEDGAFEDVDEAADAPDESAGEEQGDGAGEPGERVEEKPGGASEKTVEEQPESVPEESPKEQPVKAPESSAEKSAEESAKTAGASTKEPATKKTEETSKKPSMKKTEEASNGTSMKVPKKSSEETWVGEPGNDSKKQSVKTSETSSKEPSEKEGTSQMNASAINGVGGVTAMLGTSRISLQLKFYNNNDEKENNNEKIKGNNNNTITFKCLDQMREEKYPVIEINQTGSRVLTEDISILSLRLNGQEASWHREGNLLILDVPAREKKNRVELIAVQNGCRILRMPVWEF